jgi:hypothetical protein
MSAATTLTITMADATIVVLTIPTALQNLDAGSLGYSGPDQIIRSIFRAGCFFDSANKKAYAAAQIKNIVWS